MCSNEGGHAWSFACNCQCNFSLNVSCWCACFCCLFLIQFLLFFNLLWYYSLLRCSCQGWRAYLRWSAWRSTLGQQSHWRCLPIRCKQSSKSSRYDYENNNKRAGVHHMMKYNFTCSCLTFLWYCSVAVEGAALIGVSIADFVLPR